MSRWAAAHGLVLAATVVAAAGSEDASRPGVVVRREDGAVRVDARLSGRLVGYALPRDGNGAREIYLLVADLAPPADPRRHDDQAKEKAASPPTTLPACPAPGPGDGAPSTSHSLYRLDPAAGALHHLRGDLPPDSTAVDAADLDGDGRDELLLFRPLGLWRLEPRSALALVPLLEAPALQTSGLHPRSVDVARADLGPWVASVDLDGLSLFGPVDGSFRRMAHVDLPLDADVQSAGVELRAEAPRELGRDARGTLFFATGPESFGATRVRTTLVALDAAGASSITECWAHLPEPEDVLGSAFLWVDDRPVLLVTTKPADKLSLFGEKRVRIYPLERDRSRLGLLPLFAAESRMNVWQEGTPRMHDVDADGREDLVIAYWKGILDDRVVLDAYLRRPAGGFDERARSTSYEVKKGDRSFVAWGTDLTGDDVPDLLVRGKPGLLVFPGRRSPSGADLVEARPRLLRFADDEGEPEEGMLFAHYPGERPRLADLDGDGAHEILLVDPGNGETPGRFHLIRLERGGGTAN